MSCSGLFGVPVEEPENFIVKSIWFESLGQHIDEELQRFNVFLNFREYL